MFQLQKRSRELVIAVVLLALPLAWLRANTKDAGHLNGLDRVVLRTVAPVEHAVLAIGRSARQLWSDYIALVHVRAQNRILNEENARLRADITRAAAAAANARELAALLDLREDVSEPTVAARVVGIESSSLFQIMRLQLAAPAPVRPEMPVIAEGGVVGRIYRVYGGYADLLLASDPRSAIDVVVSRSGSRGIVKGIGEARSRMRLDRVLRDEDVKVGDAIVTSGLGGTFPRRLPIGKVVKVSHGSNGLYQEVDVEPSVDLTRLSDVLIILTEKRDASLPSASAR